MANFSRSINLETFGVDDLSSVSHFTLFLQDELNRPSPQTSTLRLKI